MKILKMEILRVGFEKMREFNKRLKREFSFVMFMRAEGLEI